MAADPSDGAAFRAAAAGADQPVRWATPGVPLATVDLSARMRQVADGFCAGADLAPLGAQLVGLREAIDQLEAAWHAAVAAFDAAGGPADDGHGSLGSWLRHRCRLSPAEAGSRARIARQTAAGALPATTPALTDGTISWRHADVIDRTLRDIPAERRTEAEAALQEPAKTLDPMLLKRVGQDLLHRLAVDRADAAAVHRLDRRGLDLAETIDGMVAVSGLLDPVAGATVLTAIDSLVSPTRGDDGDERTWPQRRADALAEICRAHLDTGEAPVSGGVRPHLSVVIDLATLRNTPGCGTAHLSWAGPITAERARQLACDAVVSRILTDGPSQILDVGRTTRTIPPALRRAVTIRDGGCVAPGCHTQPAHCDIHHIVFWADGGPTSLDNTVMVCRRHHSHIHDRDWQVVATPGGTRTLAPPGTRPPP